MPIVRITPIDESKLIHRQIDATGLPVRHTTRRQGRPFTLVLTKTEDLFKQERDTRRQTQRDLAWLVSTFRQRA